VVVDEVIAQVNDGVVTLSQLKREMKERNRDVEAKWNVRTASQQRGCQAQTRADSLSW